MVPPRGRPSPVQGTVGGAGLHRGKPPHGAGCNEGSLDIDKSGQVDYT
jgi:hypothetical protein